MSRLLFDERVAVIGATGFIGSHLTRQLLSRDCHVLAIARTTGRLSNIGPASERCTFNPCDILDRDALIRSLGDFKPTYVFHMAAHPDAQESFAQIAASIRVNTLGTMNTVEAASLCRASRLILSDSTKVYGYSESLYRMDTPAAPICSYAIAKSAAWQMCNLAMRLTNMQIVALRPSFVYGQRQNFNLMTFVDENVRNNRSVRLLGGSQTRDPLFIDDAIAAFIAAAVAPDAHSCSIPIGGGREYTVVELCREVMQALGREVPIEENAFPPRPTEIWRMYADNTDARALLRWSPSVSLPDGLRRTFARFEPQQKELHACSKQAGGMA